MEGVTHMTIFVTLNDDPDAPDEDHLYLVDVGFGAGSITQPLSLRRQLISCRRNRRQLNLKATRRSRTDTTRCPRYPPSARAAASSGELPFT